MDVKREEEVNRLRKIMGTDPKVSIQLDTPFFKGVEGIEAKLIDSSKNPFKAMFDIATSTWTTQGTHIDKWGETSIEGRKMVIKGVLEGQALPLALEAPQFTFAIEGCSRSAFDQIARIRVGAVIGSMGTRDNQHCDIGIRVPNALYREGNEELLALFKESAVNAKWTYWKIVESKKANWQVARAILPQSVIHKFSFALNYQALRGFMSHRLLATEQEDTVATAMQMWKAMWDQYPLLAAYLRPACDWAGKHVCTKAYQMNELFGNLFADCGRFPSSTTYSTFNESCSNYDTLEKQLGWHYPMPFEWKTIEETAWNAERTQKLFESD